MATVNKLLSLLVVFFVVPVLLGTALLVNTGFQSAPLTITSTPTPKLTITPVHIPESFYVPTPTISYEAKPNYRATKISAQDVLFLAALCVVETKTFSDMREDACESVVSTVLTRMEKNTLSDGTVRGTITWNCKQGDKECQFPAFTVNGCEGIRGDMCPYNYPHHLIEFVEIVEKFIQSGSRATCQGYLFYGLKDFDPPDCRIEENGWFINFHNGLN